MTVNKFFFLSSYFLLCFSTEDFFGPATKNKMTIKVCVDSRNVCKQILV